MQLSLAFCQAPRVAFNEKGAEEPYGWESREYLRKMLIGQVVKFKVLYKVDAISRSFASLEFKGKDVLRDVVEKGMVSVRSERDDKGQKELYESLLRLQSDARSAHRGIWGDKRVLRSVNWTLADPESFFKANKGLPLVGIVEQVRDGSTFRLYLPDTHDMIMLHLAGVQSPRITYSAEGEGTFGRRPISGVVVDIVGPLVLIGMRLPATTLGVADHVGDGSTKLLFEHGNIGGTRTLFISVVHVFLTSDHPGILLLKAVAARSEKTD